MHIDLTDAELDALLRLVEREISELGPEIRHTRTSSYRDDLKAQKQMLRQLREHLAHQEPV